LTLVGLIRFRIIEAFRVILYASAKQRKNMHVAMILLKALDSGFILSPKDWKKDEHRQRRGVGAAVGGNRAEQPTK